MQPSRASQRSPLRAALLAAALLFSSAAFAGPPLLCHPFDTAGAASLPWGKGGWNSTDRGYDTRRLSADTLRLLGADPAPHLWSVAPDGQRILMRTFAGSGGGVLPTAQANFTPASQAAATPGFPQVPPQAGASNALTVVRHWTAAFRQTEK